MSKVIFKKSQVEVEWTDEEASILELAEANDLDLDYGLVMGNSIACQHRIVSGEVEGTQWGILENLIPTMLSCV